MGGEELSKGQWQKLVISKIFINKSDVLILDEPTSYLDETSKKELVRNVINHYRDKIVIIITHDYKLFEEYNPNILYLDS